MKRFRRQSDVAAVCQDFGLMVVGGDRSSKRLSSCRTVFCCYLAPIDDTIRRIGGVLTWPNPLHSTETPTGLSSSMMCPDFKVRYFGGHVVAVTYMNFFCRNLVSPAATIKPAGSVRSIKPSVCRGEMNADCGVGGRNLLENSFLLRAQRTLFVHG